MKRKALSLLLILSLLISVLGISSFASGTEEISGSEENNEAENNIMSGIEADIDAKSVILMDAGTGTVLYSMNENEALPPASVTKIMTLLLVAEALGTGTISLSDTVTVSANAASKGGSQIFIKEGESFTVEELLKSTVIASANDAAVALAELVAGSEGAFVDMMNQRAAELGMKNTRFENATGLDDTVTNHLTSAYDIALMSRELIKHDVILKYSGMWQDTVRDGAFTLTNTNRLVRYYSGATGLKTGSTDKAGFCISATAKRDGMHLIAVVMGSQTRDTRNAAARALLDYGFSSYATYIDNETALEDIDVLKGVEIKRTAYSKTFTTLVNKADLKRVEKKFEIPENVTAPIAVGQKIGEVKYYLDGEELGVADIYVKEEVMKITVPTLLWRMIKSILVGVDK